MTASGRIRFPGSPWPNGHALETLTWSGRLDPESGLYFDLHLRSANYNAEVDFDDDEDVDDSWKAPIVWNNYHRCTLSSTFWDGNGVHVADEADPLNFSTLHEWVWHVDDRVAVDDHDQHSFNIYLLGHDAALRHRIQFTRAGGKFGLHWRGKIALTYVGHTDLAHSFSVESSRIEFEGFQIPDGLSPKAATAALKRFTCGPVKYRRRKGRFVPLL